MSMPIVRETVHINSTYTVTVTAEDIHVLLTLKKLQNPQNYAPVVRGTV